MSHSFFIWTLHGLFEIKVLHEASSVDEQKARDAAARLLMANSQNKLGAACPAPASAVLRQLGGSGPFSGPGPFRARQ
jgi:hypothetical protein